MKAFIVYETPDGKRELMAVGAVNRIVESGLTPGEWFITTHAGSFTTITEIEAQRLINELTTMEANE